VNLFYNDISVRMRALNKMLRLHETHTAKTGQTCTIKLISLSILIIQHSVLFKTTDVA
jgi:hypothetical protein